MNRQECEAFYTWLQANTEMFAGPGVTLVGGGMADVTGDNRYGYGCQIYPTPTEVSVHYDDEPRSRSPPIPSPARWPCAKYSVPPPPPSPPPSTPPPCVDGMIDESTLEATCEDKGRVSVPMSPPWNAFADSLGHEFFSIDELVFTYGCWMFPIAPTRVYWNARTDGQAVGTTTTSARVRRRRARRDHSQPTPDASGSCADNGLPVIDATQCEAYATSVGASFAINTLGTYPAGCWQHSNGEVYHHTGTAVGTTFMVTLVCGCPSTRRRLSEVAATRSPSRAAASRARARARYKACQCVVPPQMPPPPPPSPPPLAPPDLRAPARGQGERAPARRRAALVLRDPDGRPQGLPRLLHQVRLGQHPHRKPSWPADDRPVIAFVGDAGLEMFRKRRSMRRSAATTPRSPACSTC